MAQIKKIDWELVNGLGVKSDSSIARELGVDSSSVRRARIKFGIPPYNNNYGPKKIDWESYPLGDVPDIEIAKVLSVDNSAVARVRKRLGIKAFDKRANLKIDWDAQNLGDEPDYTIAGRLGVSEQSVSYQRKKRGIEPFFHQGKRGIDWDIQPLGEISDVDLAKKLSVSKSSVRSARIKRGIEPFFSRKYIDWDRVVFDKTDVEKAKELGVGHGAVARKRRELTGSAPLCGFKNKSQAGINWDSQPLGLVSDVELGRSLGVSSNTVRGARKKRGIKPFSSGGFVYFIGNNECESVKIGIVQSESRLNERLKEVNSGNPTPQPYAILAVIASSNPLDDERFLHSTLSGRRISPDREWFSAGKDEIPALVELVKKRAIITQSEDSTNGPKPSPVKGKKTT